MINSISASCAADDHTSCFGFTADTGLPDAYDYTAVPRADVTACTCACHTGRRSINVGGQRFDYLVPDGHPAFEDPNGAASRELAEIVRAAIERQQQADEWLPDPDERNVHIVQGSLFSIGVEPLVPAGLAVHAMPRLPLTVEDYAVQAIITQRPFDNLNDLLAFGAMGMAAESGETLNAVRKVLYQGHPLSGPERDHIVEEIGDVLWFANSLLQAVNSSLLDAMQQNAAKVHKRYQGKFSTAKSIARVDVTHD